MTSIPLPEFLADHGLLIVGLLALIEGPIVTVVAAWLAAQGHFVLWQLTLVVIIADLLGDIGFYAFGRSSLFRRWRGSGRLDGMIQHFEERGGRTLVLGKVTHSVGFAVLIAAGAARMRFIPFLWYNTLATVPKSLLFIALGYFFGEAHGRIDEWMNWGAGTGFALFLLIGVVWYFRRRRDGQKAEGKDRDVGDKLHHPGL